MDIRIHPDFQDPNLAWAANIITLVIMILLIISYKKYRNQTALIFAFACFSSILGSGILAASMQLLPDNLPMQIWIANVGAVLLFYCIYSYLALVLIYIKFRSLSPHYVLFIMLLGFISLLPSLINYEAPTLLASGGYDFHRTFLADFIQFMLSTILFKGYFSVFVSGYRSTKDKLPLLLLATGISTIMLGLPLIAISDTAQLAIIFHYVVIVGWLVTLASFITAGFINRKTKRSTENLNRQLI